MTEKQMDKFVLHCDKYFEQKNEQVIHSVVMNDLHVDILLYEPTEKHPYWKLVTMGASDYQMPPARTTVGDRNEYIMLVDKNVDMKDKATAFWYCKKLWTVSRYAYENHTHVSYRHSFEWKNDDETDEMIGAFLELPQTFDFGLLQYKAGLFRKVACLLVVLLNQDEIDRLMKIGPVQFSEYLFPENENAPRHFLSEKHRTEQF